jgi:deoxycytidine triphosphate deaminase
MTSLAELIPQPGYLTDRQIHACLQAEYLFEQGTWSKDQVRHASYTLRLGSRVDLARASDSIGETQKEIRLITLTRAQPHLDLRPGDTALLYSLEILRFPPFMLGFTVARGLLFVEALCPENTYVDPGFSGCIYTTVTNISNRVVQLSYEMSVARLYFFRLAEDVETPYRAGSALGITQQLTSMRAVPLGSERELQSAKDDELRESVRLVPIGGVHAAALFERMHSRALVAHQRIMVFALLWPAILLLVHNNEWVRSRGAELLADSAASVVTAALAWAAPYIIRWFRKVTG